MRRTRGFPIHCLATALCMAAVSAPQDVAARRQEVVAASARGAAGLPILQQGLSDENALVRRAAVRGLLELGDAARETLAAAFENGDEVVRRAALLALAAEPTAASVPYLAKGDRKSVV